VHAIQNLRKGAGLQVEDRIELALGGDDELLAAARDHEDYLAQETLAVSVLFNGAAGGTEATIEGRPLRVALRRI
jgi:isoleucyl-tRNA synthetase